MSMIFEYGRACAEVDHARAGSLYAQLSRAIVDESSGHEEAPPLSGESGGVAVLTLSRVPS